MCSDHKSRLQYLWQMSRSRLAPINDRTMLMAGRKSAFGKQLQEMSPTDKISPTDKQHYIGFIQYHRFETKTFNICNLMGKGMYNTMKFLKAKRHNDITFMVYILQSKVLHQSTASSSILSTKPSPEPSSG